MWRAVHVPGGSCAGAALCGPHGGHHIPCVGSAARRPARQASDAAGDGALRVQPQAVTLEHAPAGVPLG